MLLGRLLVLVQALQPEGPPVTPLNCLQVPRSHLCACQLLLLHTAARDKPPAAAASAAPWPSAWHAVREESAAATCRRC
jgi:hypothetical protein